MKNNRVWPYRYATKGDVDREVEGYSGIGAEIGKVRKVTKRNSLFDITIDNPLLIQNYLPRLLTLHKSIAVSPTSSL